MPNIGPECRILRDGGGSSLRHNAQVGAGQECKRESAFQKTFQNLKFACEKIESMSAKRGFKAGAKAILKDYVIRVGVL